MSKLSAALGSIFQATNENYAALANLKFDFSLIKMEAPAEFNGVVSALSDRRRVEAEEGSSHKTARRLGALFEDLVPTTPKLISAYGLRMSEIINTSGVNDIGAEQYGPFGPYVGADGTSLWAAATSGISALGVYLLSCLLARAWDAKTATAIWVEIVAARRKEIGEGIQNNHNISASAVVGAYQDISRKDLSLWDSSARAWLRTADRTTQWSQCQLELIVKNISTPIAGGPSTYDKVMSVWKKSMLAVEQLLSGKPQDIMDGTTFLAFSAWHLFPDLIVLGDEPKKVNFKDKMFPSTGVGTVGLVSSKSEKERVEWSLALSHLQYYGEPVLVRSDQDSTRMSFAQLRIVALGSLFGAWRVTRRDYLLVAEWFRLLWIRMDLPEEYSHKQTSSDFGWLFQFVAAADQLLAANDKLDDHMRLLEHGKRRGKSFLLAPKGHVSPFFGLLQTSTMCGLVKEFDIESGIAYLRAIAEAIGLKGSDAIICYAHKSGASYDIQSADFFELATILPVNTGRHLRWLCPNPNEMKKDSHSSGGYVDQEGFVPKTFDTNRMRYISRQGEGCEHYLTGPIFKIGRQGFEWVNPPSLYLRENSDDLEAIERPAKRPRLIEGFTKIVGSHHIGLYLRTKDERHEPWLAYQRKAEFEMSKANTVSTAIQNFKTAKIVPGRLRDYMCSLTCLSDEQGVEALMKAPGVAFSAKQHQFDKDFTKSLYALEVSSIIYAHLTKATISLKIISRTLFESAWFTSLFDRWVTTKQSMDNRFTKMPLLELQHPVLPTRPESFSCITLFDSGTVDLKPEDLQQAFAVCSEDTIYVPTVVLSDPFVLVPEYEMRGIIGNFNRPGISILVSPIEPQIRKLSDSYNVVRHETYDLKREDNFKGTSLHLSFTDWVVPLSDEDSRTIDHDAQIVEAVISIRDRGRWVADIDILEVDFEHMTRFKSLKCSNESHNQENLDLDYTSVDSWEEMLDEPGTVGFFRAHGNWAARLAAASILSRNESGGQNFGIVGPEPLCLRCLEEEFEKPGWDMQEYESTLPSFCID